VRLSGDSYLTVTRKPGAGWVARIDKLAERTHAVSPPFGSRFAAQAWAVAEARKG
jgi:hypothetical protein